MQQKKKNAAKIKVDEKSLKKKNNRETTNSDVDQVKDKKVQNGINSVVVEVVKKTQLKSD